MEGRRHCNSIAVRTMIGRRGTCVTEYLFYRWPGTTRTIPPSIKLHVKSGLHAAALALRQFMDLPPGLVRVHETGSPPIGRVRRWLLIECPSMLWNGSRAAESELPKPPV